MDDNGGGIAISYLDATINEGAVLEMEMVAGGWVEISTNWQDISLLDHHTGSSDSGYSMIESEVEISFDLLLGADERPAPRLHVCQPWEGNDQ